MRIALFSDVHGHLRLLLHLLRNWQMANRTYFDAALVAGDLGCFPDPTKFDKATKRWIDRDPEEAGFSRYFTRSQPEVERLFSPELGEFSDVRCPILFVAGNHEDYDYLRNASQKAPSDGILRDTFAVDCYGRFLCIRDGAVITLAGQDRTSLRVAGIWGIENTRAEAPYNIKKSTAQKLTQRGVGQFEVLLTHDAPAGAYPFGGSRMITEIIRSCRPSIHLFGHVHPIGDSHEFSVPDSTTRSLILKDVSFGKDGNEGLLGVMGVIEWDGVTGNPFVVEEQWLRQMRRGNWEQVWPECVMGMQRNATQ
jgi:Icc-related predicted phosphoesterase